MNTQLNPTQQSKAAIAALMAGDQINEEAARNIFLAVTVLVQEARTAEHLSFFLMNQIVGNGNPVEVGEYSEAMKKSLSTVRDQLKFISGLIHGKV